MGGWAGLGTPGGGYGVSSIGALRPGPAAFRSGHDALNIQTQRLLKEGVDKENKG